MLRRVSLVIVIVATVAQVSAGGMAKEQLACSLPLDNPNTGLVLGIEPLNGGPADAALEDTTSAVIAARASELSDGACYVRAMPDGTIRVALRTPHAVDFLSLVLTSRGLIEVIDPDGRQLIPGDVVRTTENQTNNSATSGDPVYRTLITNDDIADLIDARSQMNTQVLGFRLTDEAAAEFEAFTGANIGQPLAILIDKRVVSSPVIQAPIRGEGIIDGLTSTEIEALTITFRAGELDATVRLLAVKTLEALER